MIYPADQVTSGILNPVLRDHLARWFEAVGSPLMEVRYVYNPVKAEIEQHIGLTLGSDTEPCHDGNYVASQRVELFTGNGINKTVQHTRFCTTAGEFWLQTTQSPYVYILGADRKLPIASLSAPGVMDSCGEMWCGPNIRQGQIFIQMALAALGSSEVPPASSCHL